MRLLILGTGNMARAHASAFREIEGVQLVAGVDPFADNLEKFSNEFGIEHRFTSLDDAIAWGEFDAAANVTPDHIHHPTTMKLIAAGKHVFCEKPLAMNHADAKEMSDAIEAKGLVGMVNLTYRNVAHLHKMRAMIDAGDIGSVKHVDASYLQSWLVSDAWGKWNEERTWLWRLSKEHGSNGVLGDIGIHILDFLSYGSGLEITDLAARLQVFHKAENDQIGEYKLDANDSFAMHVGFDNGAIGVVHATRWATGHLNDLYLRVYGEKGGLELAHLTHGTQLRACIGDQVNGAEWHDVEPDPVPTNYQKFAQAVAAGKTQEPSFRRATNIQKFLDLALEAEQS